MNPLGWRFVVLADLGLEAKGAVTVPPGGVDEISAALRPGKEAEASLLGLALLRKHAGTAVQVDVVSCTAKDAAARFREAVFEPEMAELRNPPLGLVVVDFDVSHVGSELAVLSELAEMAKVAQAPLVAGASPAFFGLKALNLLPKLQDLPQRLHDGAHAAWVTFQKTDPARWTSLTVNRWLARSPREGEKPESFVWARGVWIVAAALARSIATHGHALDASGARSGGFGGLPTRPYPKAANQTVPLATEIEIPDSLSQELSRGAFIPIVGHTGGDSAMLPIIVNVHREAPGRLTVKGTLGYQMVAGRLAQACAFLMDELPSGAAEGCAALKAALVALLGSLAAKAPDAAVAVEPVRTKDGEGRDVTLARITVRPETRIESMEFEFVFQLPLKA